MGAHPGGQLSQLHQPSKWYALSVGALLDWLVHLRQVHPLKDTNFCGSTPTIYASSGVSSGVSGTRNSEKFTLP